VTKKKNQDDIAVLWKQKFWLNHIFGWEEIGKDVMIELLDTCQFMNHSSNANLEYSTTELTSLGKPGLWVASRDIEKGEEICDNYSTFWTPQWYLDLCRDYVVESSADVARMYSTKPQKVVNGPEPEGMEPLVLSKVGFGCWQFSSNGKAF
jgi:hypothetical protein